MNVLEVTTYMLYNPNISSILLMNNDPHKQHGKVGSFFPTNLTWHMIHISAMLTPNQMFPLIQCGIKTYSLDIQLQWNYKVFISSNFTWHCLLCNVMFVAIDITFSLHLSLKSGASCKCSLQLINLVTRLVVKPWFFPNDAHKLEFHGSSVYGQGIVLKARL